jgi:glycerol uptake facilitator-like aquaporin
MFAQILGAFVAAAVIYANYRSAIDMYEGVGIRTVIGETSTAGIFCTLSRSIHDNNWTILQFCPLTMVTYF